MNDILDLKYWEEQKSVGFNTTPQAKMKDLPSQLGVSQRDVAYKLSITTAHTYFIK